MNLEKLERMIGRDIKQVTRYAEGLDATSARLKKEIEALDTEKLRLAESLAATSAKAVEAWEYIDHLKKA